GKAHSVSAGVERAPFRAQRNTLARAAISWLRCSAVIANVVVKFLSPKAELIARAFRRREERTLTCANDARGLIRHRNSKCANSAGDIRNRGFQRGLHLT